MSKLIDIKVNYNIYTPGWNLYLYFDNKKIYDIEFKEYSSLKDVVKGLRNLADYIEKRNENE